MIHLCHSFKRYLFQSKIEIL